MAKAGTTQTRGDKGSRLKGLAGRVYSGVRAGLLAALLAVPLTLCLVTTLYAVLPPVSTLMLRDLVTLRGYDRSWINLDATAPVLVQSIIASEDQAFCIHDGVDWPALQAQVERWWETGEARGASTLSMQVARNLFLWQGRSELRKALEVPLALWLDTMLGKQRVMEIYINIAELGPQLYGFDAAARQAFDRSAANVGARQAALLVAALPLPARRDAARPTTQQVRLAGIVEQRARRMGAYVQCLPG